jgi:hypothetical protein
MFCISHRQILLVRNTKKGMPLKQMRGIPSGETEFGAPEKIRTSDLQLRRLPLYPAELRVLIH